MRDLFPSATFVVDVTYPPSADLLTVASDDATERTIRKLLIAAASWLLAEASKHEEQAYFWETVAETSEEEAEDLQNLIDQATRASCILLDHAEAGTWRSLLARYAAARPSAEHVSPTASDLRKWIEALEVSPARLQALQALQREKYVVLWTRTGTGKTTAALEVLRQVTGKAQLAERPLTLIDRQIEPLTPWAGWVSTSQLCRRKPAEEALRKRSELLLSVMRDAIANHEPDCLVVDFSGFPRAGLLDLRRGVLASEQPDVLALQAAGLVPDLRGREVLFTGLGNPRLGAYWRALCEAGGASSVSIHPAAPDAETCLPSAPASPEPKKAGARTLLNGILHTWGTTIRAIAVMVAVVIGGLVPLLLLRYAEIGASYVFASVSAIFTSGLLARWLTLRTGHSRSRKQAMMCSLLLDGGRHGWREGDRKSSSRTPPPAMVHIERTWMTPEPAPRQKLHEPL
ncbi:hypothetical protein CVV72_41190 (plasmid) [Amycolatopsis sp. TNS106]|nr:hypothetical protein CVV72_41190 [Amycolatopsis sp. TNS106]